MFFAREHHRGRGNRTPRTSSIDANRGRSVRSLLPGLSTVALCIVASLALGCAATTALRMPGPASDELIEIGDRRSEVESTLIESPTSIFNEDGLVAARYEYADGPPSWSKLRSLLYVGADVFSLFLSELIFWPIELTVKDRIQRVGVARYAADGKLAMWTVRRASDGKTLRAERSPLYDELVLAGRPASTPTDPGANPTSPPSSTPALSQQPIIAPARVTTHREIVEFKVTVADARRYPEILVNDVAYRPAADGTVMVNLPVPMGDSTLVLSAIDASGSYFVRRVSISRTNPSMSVPSSLRLGNYHALVIGNDSYANLPRLSTARSDARAIAEVLRVKYGYEVELLLDSTRSETISALAGWRKRLGPGDNLLIYYAGHGILEESEDHGYWLPIDAQSDDPAQWIANASITRQLLAMQAKHVLVIADSCYSGTLTRGISIPDRSPGYLTQLAESRSRTALTSGGIELVSDNGAGGHSVFAGALLEALYANDGLLETMDLFVKLRRRVGLDSHQTPQYAPIVQAGHDDGEFLFLARE